MVALIHRYRCDKCRREHIDYEGARSCEMAHITDAAIANVTANIAKIFEGAKARPARAKKTHSGA